MSASVRSRDPAAQLIAATDWPGAACRRRAGPKGPRTAQRPAPREQRFPQCPTRSPSPMDKQRCTQLATSGGHHERLRARWCVATRAENRPPKRKDWPAGTSCKQRRTGGARLTGPVPTAGGGRSARGGVAEEAKGGGSARRGAHSSQAGRVDCGFRRRKRKLGVWAL